MKLSKITERELLILSMQTLKEIYEDQNDVIKLSTIVPLLNKYKNLKN